MLKVAIIIPAFNEEKSLGILLRELESLRIGAYTITCVVVNDGSSDGTASVVRLSKARLLDLPVNLGIGGAVQTGLIYALEQGYDYAIQVDGDGQHPPDQIPLILEALKAADVVIGSRFLGSGEWRTSGMRRFGIRFLNFQIRLMCGIRISDCTSGFRGFNRQALKLAAEHYPDEYPEPESIILFRNRGLRIVEVPVLMKERKQGRSSIRNLLPLYYMLKVSLAVVFTYIRTKTSLNG